MSRTFTNRIRLGGTLTLQSDMYLGDGGVSQTKQAQGEGDTGVASVARGHDNKPTIPGSALRGVVRSYLEAHYDEEFLLKIFGRPAEGEEKQGSGGRVEFAYSHATATTETPVAYSVGINRRTRTAADRVLFVGEYVPRGTVFRVSITGYDLTDSELAALVHGLHGFNDDDHPVRLGANHADHNGRAEWHTDRLERTTATHLQKWMKQADTLTPWAKATVRDIPAEELKEETLFANHPLPASKVARFQVPIRLHFSAPLVVNDPHRCKPLNAAEDDNRPNHTPRLRKNGQVFLPASSFRGAFRSQAERIIRTLGGIADDPTDKDSLKDNPLDLARQMFGSTNQRALVEVTDFDAIDKTPHELTRQEFVAIDRFTGGAAEHLKFNAERYHQKLTLAGSLTLVKPQPWQIGLLILVLRDLIEGDITFGYGASKGYGACTAEIANWGPKLFPNIDAVAAVVAFREHVQSMKEPTHA